MAKSFGLMTQREADEAQAGRRFRSALDWIDWAESFKGQLSGQNFRVQIENQSGLILYTQTREYHMTGGETLVEQADGTWGCEEVFPLRGQTDAYAADLSRAATMKSIGKKLERRPTGSSLLPDLGTSFETVSSVPVATPEATGSAQTMSISPESRSSIFSDIGELSEIGASFRVMTLMAQGMSEEEANRSRSC